jgi:hypothetical protein
MSDRIYALVHSVQPTSGQSHLDRTWPEPDGDELSAGDHAMLLPCQLADGPIQQSLVDFPFNGNGISPPVGHGAIMEGEGSRGCRDA